MISMSIDISFTRGTTLLPYPRSETSPSCSSEKFNFIRVGIRNVLVPTYNSVSQNDYEGANFTLAIGNKNVPLEKLISIDMLTIQLN